MDEMFHEVSARFADRPQVRIHREMSKAAMESFADGYFDWVYIDGNHNEPFVGEDLALARRKVRPGGIIAGDDFNWQTDIGAPVRRAVEAMVADLGPAAKFRLLANQYMIRLPA